MVSVWYLAYVNVSLLSARSITPRKQPIIMCYSQASRAGGTAAFSENEGSAKRNKEPSFPGKRDRCDCALPPCVCMLYLSACLIDIPSEVQSLLCFCLAGLLFLVCFCACVWLAWPAGLAWPGLAGRAWPGRPGFGWPGWLCLLVAFASWT